MKKLISVLLIVLTVFSLAGCKAGLEGAQPDGEIVSNGGIAIKQGDWLYVINGTMPDLEKDALQDSPRSKIFRMKADGTERKEVTDKKAFGMYIYEDKIFFTTPMVNGVQLYCINVDGTGQKRLLNFSEGEYVAFGEKGVAVEKAETIVYFDYETLEKKEFETGNVDGIKVTESYIYYYVINKTGTKRIELSSGNVETVTEMVGPVMSATDTEVFVVSTRLIYKVDTNTLETTQVSDTYYEKLVFNLKNRVAIVDESETTVQGIFVLPLDNVAGRPVGEDGNKPRLQLHSKDAAAFCADDEHIYFVEAETGDVYSMTYEGKEKTVLGKLQSIASPDSMDIVGDTLVIHDSAESGRCYFVAADGSSKLQVIGD